jgi:helicase
MRIEELPVSEEIKNFYITHGITQLYPPQEEAIWTGVLDGVNLVAAIPTASGKTLIAELAMLTSIQRGGKALYIVPLKALASEKYESFKKFEELGVKVGISTGDFESRDEWLSHRDIIIATSEKVDSLLRNRAAWMEDISMVVADEIHLIDSPSRGPTLEVILAKLKNTGVQILALSATIGNPEELAEWLEARLITSDWRPVELREGVCFGNAVNWKGGAQQKIEKTDRDATVNLVLDTLKDGGQCLIFESTRKNAEASAKRVARALKEHTEETQMAALKQIAENLKSTSDTDTINTLAACIESGAAFHHAGLTSEQRSLIENAYRRGILKVISSTPTLAAGLNLPARRVIIRGYKRYDANRGAAPIPVLEYKQMAGRAGRPALDPYGEAVVIAKSFDEAEWIKQNYLSGEPEHIWSKLASEPALRAHILSLITTQYAESLDELVQFLTNTFYAHQRELWEMQSALQRTLIFLENSEMIVEHNSNLYPTDFGVLVSKLYLDPLSASIMAEELEEIPDATDLTLLHILCRTPDMQKLYMRQRDYLWVEEFAGEHHGELLPPCDDYEWYLAEIKTTALLYQWINEVPEKELCTRYNIGEGDIRHLSETAQWLVHAEGEIARHLKHPLASKLRQLERRIEYGASTELLPLIALRNIGRVRARKLYNAGYHTPEKLKNATHAQIAAVIGEKTAEKLLIELHHGNLREEERGSLEEQKNLKDY